MEVDGSKIENLDLFLNMFFSEKLVQRFIICLDKTPKILRKFHKICLYRPFENRRFIAGDVKVVLFKVRISPGNNHGCCLFLFILIFLIHCYCLAAADLEMIGFGWAITCRVKLI